MYETGLLLTFLIIHKKRKTPTHKNTNILQSQLEINVYEQCSYSNILKTKQYFGTPSFYIKIIFVSKDLRE